jgi:hypothetical protein
MALKKSLSRISIEDQKVRRQRSIIEAEEEKQDEEMIRKLERKARDEAKKRGEKFDVKEFREGLSRPPKGNA